MSEPVVFQKSPIVQKVEPGTYWWCACGRSASQPFCDGSHKGTGLGPRQVEIKEGKHGGLVRLQALGKSTLLRRNPQPVAVVIANCLLALRHTDHGRARLPLNRGHAFHSSEPTPLRPPNDGNPSGTNGPV